jgi:hypothetical protein
VVRCYLRTPTGTAANLAKFIRSRVLKSTTLVVGSSSVIDCVVRNLNSASVRVQIPSAADLPEASTMTLDGGRTMGSCRIV